MRKCLSIWKNIGLTRHKKKTSYTQDFSVKPIQKYWQASTIFSC